jgi:hypothetical protein
MDTEDLRMKLVVAQLDYQDNTGSDQVDDFYVEYVRAYRAYWSVVDPLRLRNIK